MNAGRAQLLASVTEAQWQRQVITWARNRGWLVHHVHDSRHEEWGTDAGFPDLVLARRKSVLFIELKKIGGKVRASQGTWWANLPNYYVFRPTDEDDVKRVLE